MQPHNESELRKIRLEQIIREYADMIFRIAYNNLGNVSDAEDILQEVSLTLVTCDAPLHDEQHLRFWLCRVTLNKCRNHRKSLLRRKTEPLTEDIPYSQKEYTGVIEQLRKLPDKYRTVLFLYYYEDMTIEQIARVMQKNSNTVGSQLRRGKELLRKILTDGGYNNV